MNHYKKYAAIGGAVALVACWPLAVGQFAQSQISERIGAFDQQDNINVELVDYDRGYLNATARSKVTITEPMLKQLLEEQGLPTTITLSHQIDHGFFGISTETSLKEATSLPIQVTTNTSLMGATSVDVNNQKMTVSMPDNSSGSISFLPSNIHASFTTDGAVSFNYTFPNINSQSTLDDSNLNLKGVSGSGQGKKIKDLWIGEQTLNIEQLTMSNFSGDTSQLTVNQFNYKFDTKEDKEAATFSSHHQATIDKIDFLSDSLTNFNLGVSFKDIDMDAFTNLFALIQSGEQFTTADEQLINNYADTIYQKGFTIALDKVHTNLGDGIIDADWRLTIPPSTGSISKNPMNILSAVQGETNVFLSDSLINKYPMVKGNLEQLIQEKFISHQADGYHANGKIIDGNIEFESGGSLPLISLLFLM